MYFSVAGSARQRFILEVGEQCTYIRMVIQEAQEGRWWVGTGTYLKSNILLIHLIQRIMQNEIKYMHLPAVHCMLGYVYHFHSLHPPIKRFFFVTVCYLLSTLNRLSRVNIKEINHYFSVHFMAYKVLYTQLT